MTAPQPRMDVITERLESAKHHGAPAFMIPTADVAYLLAELRKAQDKLARVEKLIESPFASADKRHYEDDFNRGHVAGYNAAAHLLRAAVADASGGDRG